MQISEIIPDATRIFSECPESDLFPKIGRALTELANMGTWDWSTARRYITFNVEELEGTFGFFTMPAFVQQPLMMNLDCHPAFARSKLFIHHFNGPGERSRMDCVRFIWDDEGEYVINRRIIVPTALTAVNLNALDASLKLRVYGLDADGHIVYDATGAPGVDIDMNTTSAVVFSSVTGIFRPLGAGVITLTAALDGTQLGYYYPDETSPRYRRVKVPRKCKTATVTYKIANQPITCEQDWVPIRNKQAIVAGLWYIYWFDLNEYDKAEQARMNAKRSLNEEQDQNSIQSPVGPQIQNLTKRTWGDRLYGGAMLGTGTGPFQGGGGGCC